MTYPLTTLVAEEVSNTGPEFGEASPIGLLIVVLLLIGVFVLVRSMNRHLKRVPQSFDAPDDADSRELPRESGG
jgi:ABC-type Fe3+ transport system permease subunit